MISNEQKKIRAGCKDMWNAFMVKGAIFSTNEIPFCPTTATDVPNDVISYVEARAMYNHDRKCNQTSLFTNAFVHFYIDDYKFDGKLNGIWNAPQQVAEVLRHFAGIITPDFSTYADFPIPLKLYNTYRMRAFGYWYGKLGGKVINNVRWGREETFSYCFDGIEPNSTVAIGTAASGLHKKCNRELFEVGFKEMLKVLKPHTIIVYGSANYPWFDNIRDHIRIVSFKSETTLRWERVHHE